MTKQSKSVLGVILAIVLAFSAFGGTAWAQDDLDAYYVQVDPPPVVAGQFTVALYIDTSIIYPPTQGAYFDVDALAVTLGTPESPATTYYVVDVLVAAAQQYPQLAFLDSSGRPITSSSSYVETVEITSGGTVYSYSPEPNVDYMNGWMFRVNDKFPLLAGSSITDPTGAAINQAYIVPGDEVFLYFADMLDTAGIATYFPRFERVGYDPDTGDLAVLIYASDSYYDSRTYDWIINPFAPFVNQRVTIAVGSSNYATSTDASGIAVINVSALPSGTAIILRPQFNNYPSYNIGIPYWISANTVSP
jgi:hypothetical protein